MLSICNIINVNTSLKTIKFLRLVTSFSTSSKANSHEKDNKTINYEQHHVKGIELLRNPSLFKVL